MSSRDDDVPAIIVTPRSTVVRRRPIDAVARARYLDVLAKTGSRMAAAAAARPHLRTRQSAMRVFEDHIRSNPQFAAQVTDVETHVAGQIDEELIDRALNGKVVYRKLDAEGKVLEERIDHDNGLLLKMARHIGRRVDPAHFAPEEKKVVVEGGTASTVKHVVEVDRMLDNMSTEAIRALVSAVDAARVLPAGADQAEEADLVDDEHDPVEAALSKSLDNGAGGN